MIDQSAATDRCDGEKSAFEYELWPACCRLALPGRAAGTPRAVVIRTHDETAKILATQEMKERFENTLPGDAVGNAPGPYPANIRDDVERWGKIVRQTGIRLE